MLNLIFWLAAIVGACSYGVLYRSTHVLVLAGAIFLYGVLGCFFCLFKLFAVSCTPAMPIAVCDADKSASFTLQVYNKSFFTFRNLSCTIQLTNKSAGLSESIRLTPFSARSGKNEYSYPLVFETAGYYEISVRKLCLYDPFGWLYLAKKGRGFCNLCVLPNYCYLPVQISLPVAQFAGESETYDESHPGNDSSEIFDVREYRPGDSMKNIHWKLSARAGDLLVKENSLPKACAVLLLLSYIPRKKSASFGAWMTAVSTIAFSLMDSQCPFFAVWFREDTEDVTRLRVDSEETFFLFLQLVMSELGPMDHSDIIDQYREKYRFDIFLHTLSVDSDLVLYKDGSRIKAFSEKNLIQELEGTELDV